MKAGGVFVVDGATLTEVEFIKTGVGPHGLYPSRDGTRLYVANRGMEAVHLYEGTVNQVMGDGIMKHRRHKREPALVRISHRFHHTEVLDERRGQKIDSDSLCVLPLGIRSVHYVAIEPVHPRIRPGCNGRGVHHGEGW